MDVFIFLGPPGSGKGTQGRLLSRSLGGATLLGMGELFRQEMEHTTDIGNSLREVINEGGLVSSDLAMQVLQKNWPKEGKKGVILDGIPRNLDQVHALEELMKGMSGKVALKRVFAFSVDPETLISRMMDRLCCAHCGVSCSSHVQAADIVDCCIREEGHEFYRRSDDFSDVIRHRLELYEKNAQEIFSHYRHILVEVNGKKNIQDTHASILKYCVQ